MKYFLITLTCLLGIAFAQWDLGVEIEHDEFTGERTCHHMILVSVLDATGFRGVVNKYGPSLVISHAVDSWRYDSAFNLHGMQGGELVYLKFSDADIITVTPVHVWGNLEHDNEAALITDYNIITKILSAPSDIRVRFSGPDGEVDFTIPHNIVVALAAGFGQSCL